MNFSRLIPTLISSILAYSPLWLSFSSTSAHFKISQLTKKRILVFHTVGLLAFQLQERASCSVSREMLGGWGLTLLRAYAYPVARNTSTWRCCFQYGPKNRSGGKKISHVRSISPLKVDQVYICLLQDKHWSWGRSTWPGRQE